MKLGLINSAWVQTNRPTSFGLQKTKEIKDLGIDGSISIELEYSPEPDRIVEWVTEAYQATDKLMQSIDLRDGVPF